MIYRDADKYKLKLNSDLIGSIWDTRIEESRYGDVIRIPIKEGIR